MTKKRSILSQKPLIKPSKRILSISILANGSHISKEAQLVKIETNHSLNQIPTAAIELADPDFQWCDSANFLPGVALKINLGYNEEEKEIFRGIVVSQTMKPTGSGNLLILELQDSAFVLNSTKRASVYNEMTDSEIVLAVIGRYPGLSVEIENAANIPLSRIQANCSDWNFILEIANSNGYHALLKSGELTLKKLALSGNAVSKLAKSNLYDYNLQLDSNSLHENIKGKVWNYQDQTVEEVDFQLEEGLPKELAESIGLPDFELLENQYDPFLEMSSTLQNKLSESILSIAKGSLKIPGTADFNAGDIVELTDFGQRISGNALVSGISHIISNGQWHTKLEIGLPDRSDEESSRTSFSSLHIGIVSALEGDPLQQNRIKIKLPLIDSEAEGVWARICLPDAGNLRGIHFLPEIGDEVVISFLGAGFKNPVILGALHSSGNPAPIPESDDSNLKGIFTRNKLKLIFDDDEKSILIETPQGNRIKLSDENQIQVEDSVGNKITLHQDGITIESIKDLNLKAAGNLNLTGINIKAASAASLELIGSAGAELSSSASTVVKGAIVQIN
jgi:phage protein D